MVAHDAHMSYLVSRNRTLIWPRHGQGLLAGTSHLYLGVHGLGTFPLKSRMPRALPSLVYILGTRLASATTELDSNILTKIPREQHLRKMGLT